MTADKVIEILTTVRNRPSQIGSRDAEINMAIDTAIEAVEKQLPQKIIYNTIVNEYTLDSRMFFNCPNCKSALAFMGLDYCWTCGQALDWSDIDRRHTPESEVEE